MRLQPEALRFSSLGISQAPHEAKKEAGWVTLSTYIPFKGAYGHDAVTYNGLPIGKSPVVGSLTQELYAAFSTARANYYAANNPPNWLGRLINLVRRKQPEYVPFETFTQKAYEGFLANHPRLNEELADAVDHMEPQEVTSDLPPVTITNDEIRGLARHILMTGTKVKNIAWHASELPES